MTKEFTIQETIQERTYSCFWYSNFNSDTKKEIISRTVDQVIGKFKKHWKFQYYIKDDDYTRLVNFLLKNSFSYLLENFNELYRGELFHLMTRDRINPFIEGIEITRDLCTD